MMMTTWETHITSETAMRQFGMTVGSQLHGGESFVLVGDIGAGKTTFTKGLAQGLRISDPVQSPTFTINRRYSGRDGLELAHYDFYRLPDAGIMADELNETSQEGNVIIVVEWADVVSQVLPRDHLTVTFASPTETSRQVSFTANGPGSTALLNRIVS